MPSAKGEKCEQVPGQLTRLLATAWCGKPYLEKEQRFPLWDSKS